MNAADRVRALRITVVLTAFVGLNACTGGPIDAIGLGDLTRGLIAHYTFDEGAGTVVVDHSGNKRDGALTNGTWIADG
ncbi:MAG: hypothetical protein M3O46_10525, partial [Myxococcota bacterium]|nr:hypothetical protein [Myxococcota bacterium]